MKNLSYTESSIKIDTSFNHYGIIKLASREVNFSPRTFSKSSFLARVLDANSFEQSIHRKDAARLLGALEHFANSKSCWEILQSEPIFLSPQSIVELLIYLEDRIEVGNVKHKDQKASKERVFFGAR